MEWTTGSVDFPRRLTNGEGSSAPAGRRLVRFGVFEADLESGELRRAGARIKLQGQPFQLLALLLEKPGEVVTREEIQQRLWPADTFVDFDHGLNTAMRKLRTALSDSADTPRFVETLPRKGYRFICPVDGGQPPSAVPGEPTVGGQARAPVLHKIILALVVIAIAIIAWRATRKPPPSNRSVAVLPFINLSGKPEFDYLSDGMSDEIINALARLPELRVVARSSSFAFGAQHGDAREIGKRLGVATIVEGSVQKSGNHLRVTAKLVDVQDGFNHWSQRFDRELTDVFAIQDEIATAVASALRAKVASGGALVHPPTTDLEAYALYVRGRSAAATRTKERFDQAIVYYRAALDRDPQLGEAWAGLADVYSQMDHGVGLTMLKPAQTYALAIETAKKALTLDPQLAEAHAAMGHILAHLGQFADAETHLRRAVQLNPNSVVAHIWYATLLRALRRFPEARPHLATALQIDPLSTFVAQICAINRWMIGDYALGVEAAAAGIRADPDSGEMYIHLARNFASMGDHQKAAEAIAHAAAAKIKTPFVDEERALLLALAGRKAEASALLSTIEQNEAQPVAASMFRAYAAAGDSDNAARWLDRLVTETPEYARLAVDLPDHPAFPSFRTDARYANVRKKLGLP